MVDELGGAAVRHFCPRVAAPDAKAPESVLGMVRLVEVLLKQGSRACPPCSSAGAVSGGQLSPFVPGAEAPGNCQHCRGLERIPYRAVIKSLPAHPMGSARRALFSNCCKNFKPNVRIKASNWS